MSTTANARARRILLLASLLVCLCAPFFALQVHAQAGLPGIERAVSIRIAPLHPGPGDTVTVTAQSPSFDLSQAHIVWSSRGKTLAAGIGADSASVTIGAL